MANRFRHHNNTVSKYHQQCVLVPSQMQFKRLTVKSNKSLSLQIISDIIAKHATSPPPDYATIPVIPMLNPLGVEASVVDQTQS